MSRYYAKFRCWLLVGVLLVSACQRAQYALAPVAETKLAVPMRASFDTLAANISAPRPILSVCSQPPVRLAKWLPARRGATVRHLVPRPGLPARLVRRLLATGPLVQQPSAAHVAPQADKQPVHYRSRGIALALALLSITYLPFSLHNFYLGYSGRGAAAIGLLLAGAYLLFIGLAGSILSGGGVLAIAYIGAAILAAWFFWQLSDVVRIISGSLKPKDGDYYPRFFQLRPTTSSKSLGR